jgi:hypothetical protein
MSPVKKVVTFNEPTTATLTTINVDWSSTNFKEGWVGQRVGDASNWQGTIIEANGNCDRQSPICRSPSLPTPELGSDLGDPSTLLSSYLGEEDVNETWADHLSWYTDI